MSKAPTVTIALPVYNGENYLREAVDSILAQTYTDFELIISDNCSTDHTWEICQDYAKQDVRVRLHQNETNIGANGNFNMTVGMARGKYFKWAAHDDLLAPTYLEKCVKVLDSDSSVIVCHSYTQLIDKNGKPFTEMPANERLVDKDGGIVFLGTDSPDRKLDSPRANERLYAALLQTTWVYEIFGVMRTHILQQIPLLEDYYGTDGRMLVDLATLGRIVVIPEYLFINRRHPKQSLSLITNEDRLDWSNPKKQISGIKFRLVHLQGYLRAIMRPRMSLNERIACFYVLSRYYIRLKRFLNMFEEVTGLRRFKLLRELQEQTSHLDA